MTRKNPRIFFALLAVALLFFTSALSGTAWQGFAPFLPAVVVGAVYRDGQSLYLNTSFRFIRRVRRVR